MYIHPLSSSSALNAIGNRQMASAANAASTNSNSTAQGAVGLTPGQDLGTTFLNLLATELQTQDPTSPMDPTAMVGQMISLNQLDQLIAINQTLSGLQSPTTSTGAAAHATAAAQQKAFAALGGK